MNDLNQNENKKSFWSRPEGVTGMAAIAAGGVGLWFALPFLLALLTGLVAVVGQAITLTILGLVLGGLWFIISDKKVQTLVKYAFKSSMRAITGAFVEIDPIGIMKSYVDDLVNKRETMSESRSKLKGQITVLERKIKENDSGIEQAMSMASIAKQQDKASQFQVQARQAGRLQKLNDASFKPLLTQMQIHLRALDKYYEVTGIVIDDLRNEVKAREMEREMILSSYSAMSTAKKILNGGTDDRELFDHAMEFVVEDYGMKMGEIDAFIENSKGFVESLDMQNGVYEAEALRKLQEWENKADSVLLGSAKQTLLENTAVNSTINLGIGVPSPMTVDYDNIVRK